MADKPYKRPNYSDVPSSGMFGGIPAPIDWEQGGQSLAPLFPPKQLASDNPFFESEQYPMTIPLKPHPPEAIDKLAKGMTAKFGNPSPQVSQRSGDVNQLDAILQGLNINPSAWEAMLTGTMPSPNVEDKRNTYLGSNEFFDNNLGTLRPIKR